MAVRKKTDATTKKPHIPFVVSLFRITIVFLAIIGDSVILIGKGILFILRKAFSICKDTLRILTHYLEKKPFSTKTERQVKEQLLPFKQQFDSSTTQFKTLLIFIAQITRFIHNGVCNLISLMLDSLEYIGGIAIDIYNFVPGLIKKIPKPHPPTIHLKLKIPHPPKLLTGIVIGSLLTFILVFIPYNIYIYLRLLPNPRLLSQRVIPVTTQIYDRNGTLLYEIFDGQDRKPVPLSEIPQIIKDATIAIEDRNFYNHPGFSVTGIIRAARETFINHKTQGGSTITQQLIKNALLTPEVSFRRKLHELVLAFWAERVYSKDQILEMYLNQVPYGGTAWGIESAAEMYFGKKVTDLDLAEAAYLAGLPAAPSYYSPYGTRPDLAQLRQKEVLRSMVESGFISQSQADTAGTETLSIKPKLTNIKAPHFVMYVRQVLAEKFGERLVDQGGLRITTSLDLLIQEKAQQIVTQNVNALKSLNVGNGAAIVTNSQNGDILAMVGSKEYFDEANDGNVNVVLAERQPGSSIKVINYAAALQKGMTAATFIEDSPVSFGIPGQPAYAPVNYDGKFHGNITLRAALANSYNVPAVKVLNRVGVKTMVELGKQMGISTWNDDSRFGLSLTLGGGEVKLLDMSTVYGVLANSGYRIDPDPLLKVIDYTGHIYYEKGQPDRIQVLPSAIAYILSDILADNAARTPAFGPNSALGIPGKTVAVKTGTTNDKRDNWTIGYTPDYVVGVWVGNNDNTPMNPHLTSGITGASPIWNQIMTYLLEKKADKPFSRPPEVISVPCFGRNEYFLSGTQPENGCTPPPNSTPDPSSH